MKLRALRVGTRDESDARLLARACGITTSNALIELVSLYFPRKPLDPRRRVMIAQFADTIADDDHPKPA